MRSEGRKSTKRSAWRITRVFLLIVSASLFLSFLSSCARMEHSDREKDSGSAGFAETMSPYEEKARAKMREKGISEENAEALYRLLLTLGMKKELLYIVPVSDFVGQEVCFRIWWENGDCTVLIGENGDLSLLSFETEPVAPSREIPIETEAPDTETKPEETVTPEITTAPKETSPPETTREPIIPVSSEETTAFPETKPPETTAESRVPETTAGNTIRVLSFTDTVKPGGTASLQILGKPNTTYKIRVKYASGYSGASGLEEKTAGSDGVVTWSWRVGASTTPGSYPVTLTGSGETLTLSLVVLPREEAASDTPERTVPEEGIVVNTNTKKYHRPDCRYASSIDAKNRLLLATREEAEEMGFHPCKVCCP